MKTKTKGDLPLAPPLTEPMSVPTSMSIKVRGWLSIQMGAIFYIKIQPFPKNILIHLHQTVVSFHG